MRRKNSIEETVQELKLKFRNKLTSLDYEKIGSTRIKMVQFVDSLAHPSTLIHLNNRQYHHNKTKIFFYDDILSLLKHKITHPSLYFSQSQVHDQFAQV